MNCRKIALNLTVIHCYFSDFGEKRKKLSDYPSVCRSILQAFLQIIAQDQNTIAYAIRPILDSD